MAKWQNGLRAVLHVSASWIDGAAALQVDAESMPGIRELISALPDESAEVAEARAVGIGSDGHAFGQGSLLLLEAALVPDVRALPANVYIMVSRAIVGLRVEGKRPPR